MKDKKLLILFHGYGANGMDLMPIGDYIKKAVTKFELDYFAPDAFEICDSNPYGFQWFKLSPDRDYSYNAEVEKVSAKVLSDIIIQETQNRHIKISDVILCGFSQGGMVALSTSLTTKDKPLATIFSHLWNRHYCIVEVVIRIFLPCQYNSNRIDCQMQ